MASSQDLLSTPNPTTSSNSNSNSSKLFTPQDVAHASDFPTPLQHGIIRFVPGPNVSPELKANFPVKSDRTYVYVPAGWWTREAQGQRMSKILEAMNLPRPSLILGVAASEGTQDEQIASCFNVKNPEFHPLAKDWPPQHVKEVLVQKTMKLLTSTVESCQEVGGWIMPQAPRRRNGAAQMICQAIPKNPNGPPPIAVGCLGLTEQDEENGFKEALTSTMEPFGSPARQVAALDWDPDIKDHAPCPQLTHLLIFESPVEMEQWRSELLALVPDMLLAFGDLTPAAIQSVFEQAVDGSPIILLKHTSTDVNNLCSMFKHCNAYIQQRQAHQEAAVPHVTASSGNKIKFKVPPMENMDDDMINLFVSMWPANFKPASVVVADPLLLNSASFQKRILASITATFDLKVGSDDHVKAHKQALDYAWSFYDVAHRHTALKKAKAENLHYQLVAFTLISIMASVFYNQIFGGQKGPSTSPIPMIMYVSTIVLPLYITSLKQETDQNNPVIKWTAFQAAKARMESEIFKFRAQVGAYNSPEKTDSSLRQALNAFSTKKREIWSSIKKYMADDGMHIPDSFWEAGSPAEEQQISAETIKGALGQLNSEQQGIRGSVTQVNKMVQGGLEQVQSAIGGWVSNNDDTEESEEYDGDYEKIVNETTGLLPILEENGKGGKDDEDDDSDTEEGVLFDNHYSALTAEEYMEIRMKKVMTEKVKELQSMVDRNDKISFTIKVITVMSGATAALSLQWFVPVVLGITASFTSGQEFRKYPRRIQVANQMIVHLNEIKLWWMSLSMYQRKLPHNKEKLVHDSEKAILAEFVAAFDDE